MHWKSEQFLDDVGMVVAAGIKAMQKNKAFVIPGLRSSFLASLSRLIPINLSTAIAGRVLEPSVKIVENSRES